MSDSNAKKKPRLWLVALLVILPAWLLLSGGVAVWHYFHQEKKESRKQQEAFSRSVSVAAIRDDLSKFVEVIGERHASSDAAAVNLGRAASMIEGSLGPSNTGYEIKRLQGPGQWPILHAKLPGSKAQLPALWVVCTYDSRPGSPGVEANATGLAATLAAAQALAGSSPERDVVFAFLPHGNDPESPVLETLGKLATLAGKPEAILCVEAMGAGAELWLTSRDANATPLARVSGLGTVRGAEVVCLGEDSDLASSLFEMNLPAVRVSTRATLTPDEADNSVPDPAALAASAGRLVELIRRCAAIP